MNPEVVVVGAGNLGQALIRRVAFDKKRDICVVLKHLDQTPSDLIHANVLYCTVDKLPIIPTHAVVILSTKDHQVNESSRRLRNLLSKETIIAHTSGSYGPEIIDDYFQNRSVFYPLQSFTKNRQPNWPEIPVFVEANPTSKKSLEALAALLECQTYPINEQLRLHLHTASVFANNFTNANLMIAKALLQQVGMELDILKALLNETLSKALEIGPELAQTGPAKRHDHITVSRHLSFLKTHLPQAEEIYITYSDYIAKTNA